MGSNVMHAIHIFFSPLPSGDWYNCSAYHPGGHPCEIVKFSTRQSWTEAVWGWLKDSKIVFWVLNIFNRFDTLSHQTINRNNFWFWRISFCLVTRCLVMPKYRIDPSCQIYGLDLGRRKKMMEFLHLKAVRKRCDQILERVLKEVSSLGWGSPAFLNFIA